MSLKWILAGVLFLMVFGFISFQAPGVQCPPSMTYSPGIGCVSGATQGKEQFVDGKDMYPSVPDLKIGPTPVLTQCWNGTRARDGRCPEFWGP